MLDTIELLETIGKSPSLRYASPLELTGTLKQARASDALVAATASGDSGMLSLEFGAEDPVFAPQITNAFWPIERG